MSQPLSLDSLFQRDFRLPPRPRVRPLINNGDGTLGVVLTKGFVATIDAADRSLVENWNWYAFPQGRTVYAARTVNATRSRTVLMHRVVMGLRPGAPDEVDHINHDGLNCRRSNLRLATHAQNMANSQVRTRKYVGVSSVAGRGWRATVGRVYAGYYRTEIEAARARDDLAIRLHGEFAHLNFPVAS